MIQIEEDQLRSILGETVNQAMQEGLQTGFNLAVEAMCDALWQAEVVVDVTKLMTRTLRYAQIEMERTPFGISLVLVEPEDAEGDDDGTD